ncbi:hypothetical protein GCM10010169_42880 [Micromonospora fulviviridis]|uniref:hypothetical protein n=1 Tax=Micromonospora fulviviridis TaxID=47860 RepID=UPI0016675813|nr:hypothetical protein [Micromonospora fulviviridis]GGR93858.1 hypothetical protein GCM10010169_42880 [Micromonospora fulviviridis]
MSFRRSDRPADRAESERLLDAARAGTPPEPGGDPLAHLLAAAAAPGAPGELAGGEQALAAFRPARAAPAPVPAVAPRPRHRFRLGAALAGLAATATAGVAFAAVSLDRGPEPAPPQPTTSGSTGAGSTGATGPGTPTDSGSGSAGPSGGVPSTAPTSGASGGPGRPPTAGQLAGLCRGYLAKSDRQRAQALETPAFADLVTAAGGADRVEGYCLALVPEKSPEPAPKPSADAGGKTPSTDDRRATPSTPAAPTPRTGKPTTAPGR